MSHWPGEQYMSVVYFGLTISREMYNDLTDKKCRRTVNRNKPYLCGLLSLVGPTSAPGSTAIKTGILKVFNPSTVHLSIVSVASGCLPYYDVGITQKLLAKVRTITAIQRLAPSRSIDYSSPQFHHGSSLAIAPPVFRSKPKVTIMEYSLLPNMTCNLPHT
ncbi:uncharacterized protein RSE6_03850 [Rhynchosporium secalis]|uniref:Uncharacterized protein n=1 Tax=Rhynchosporium secalis TaxID=38038 RepID=A0A1E1M3U8_RHYSE|nr:uncharacterized protein RSE6_03850 [Rhynchosporium secalis]